MVLAALFVQFGLAYLYLGISGREPWPALLFPGFGLVSPVEGTVETVRLEVGVELEDGEQSTLTTTEVLAAVPQSMHIPVSRRLRALPSYSPTLAAWLVDGASRATGRSVDAIDAIELRWVRERRPVAGSAESEANDELERELEREYEILEVRRVVAPR